MVPRLQSAVVYLSLSLDNSSQLPDVLPDGISHDKIIPTIHVVFDDDHNILCYGTNIHRKKYIYDAILDCRENVPLLFFP